MNGPGVVDATKGRAFPSRRAFLVVGAVALLARVAVVAWAVSRFPAAGDGTYYDLLARRLAAGLGYTWAWPDGAVTYVAHYPVGYPALLAGVYAVLGSGVGAAMALNGAFGVATALAMQGIVAEAAGVGRGLLAGLLVALHPALLFYTPALMTEGVGAALGALALWAVVVLPGRGRTLLGVVVAGGLLGVATLVRPQLVVLAPVFGLLAVPATGRRPGLLAVGGASLALAVALAVATPWALRNCARMDRCGLSFNGGWNLLIGTQTKDGAWAPVDVPDACRTVWDEAAKDACFGAEARARIRREPRAFLAAMPRKIAVTLDYFGGGPWYLHTANERAFPESAKVVLGALETVVARLLLVVALAAAGWSPGASRGRRAITALGIGLAVLRHAWPAYVLLAGLLVVGRRSGAAADGAGRARSTLGWGTAAIVGATVVTHGVFFGAGRYGLLVVPFVTAVAALATRPLQALAFDGKRKASTPNRGSLARLARAPREESPSSEEHDAG